MQTVLQPPSREEPGVMNAGAERLLRYASIAFIVAVAIHGADHMYRGIEDQSPQVISAGTIQAVLGAITVVLVFRRHRWAPPAAVVVGLASALLFAAAHVLPTWGFLSDSYVTPAAGAGVTWFSWVTAVLEIGADLAFGWAGANALVHARATEPVV